MYSSHKIIIGIFLILLFCSSKAYINLPRSILVYTGVLNVFMQEQFNGEYNHNDIIFNLALSNIDSLNVIRFNYPLSIIHKKLSILYKKVDYVRINHLL